MVFQLSGILNKDKVFLVKRSELEERLDCEYYNPSHYRDLALLEKSTYSTLKLKNICARIVDGPFGSAIKADDYVVDGVPFIRVADVTHGEGTIKNDNLIYISHDAHKVISRSKVIPGDVVIAKTGATMGAASVVPDEIPEANIRGDLAAITLLKEHCSAEYAITYINTQLGQRLFWRLDSGGTRGRVVIGNLKKYPVVIPPHDLQKNIVSKMNAARASKKQKEAQAQQLLDSIDNYLLNKLGIELLPEEGNNISQRMFVRKFSEVSGGRYDASFYLPKYKALTDAIRKEPNCGFCDLVGLSNELWDQVSLFQTTFPYIEIGEIDTTTGEIKAITDLDINEAPSRAKIVVKTGDLLISTTRPTRGAIALFNGELAIASTGFCVVKKVNYNRVNKMYLFHVLRSHLCRNQMEQRSSGGNYPAITTEELKKMFIPLPTLEKQNEIAAHIQDIRDQAKQLRAEAAAGLEHAKREVEMMILGQD